MSATAAVTELLQRLVRGILSDPAEAEAYSQNPAEYLAAYGVADHDLSEVDMRPIVIEAAKEFDLPDSSMAMIDDYAKGEPPTPRAEVPATSPPPARAVERPPVEPPAGMSPLQSVEQHINYATYVCHETNTDVVQNLIENTNIMHNSSAGSSEVGGAVYGNTDLTNEVTNVNATADSAVAVDDDIGDSKVDAGSRYSDNSGTGNSADSSINVDVVPGGGRSGGPEPSGGDRMDDPGFGRGETSAYLGSDRSPGDEFHAMPGSRDGNQEQYDDGYDQQPDPTGMPQREPAPGDRGYEDASPVHEEAAPMLAESPLEAIDPIQDVRVGRSADDIAVMD